MKSAKHAGNSMAVPGAGGAGGLVLLLSRKQRKLRPAGQGRPPREGIAHLLPVTHLPSQVSKISLVDLAGSERADSTGAKGTRLKVWQPLVAALLQGGAWGGGVGVRSPIGRGAWRVRGAGAPGAAPP